MRILVVEDEPRLRATLRRALEEDGYAIDSAEDGESGLQLAKARAYDAVVLDVMLPKLDGFQVLERLRRVRTTPVLMLTARHASGDRVRGLDSGADDYLPKPFDLRELLARLRAIIRRAAGQASSTVVLGDVVVDLKSRAVTRGGAPVDLTAREIAILSYLALRRGEVVTRDALHHHALQDRDEGLSNVVDVHVSHLRRKLGQHLIITRRGMGYTIPR
jgi:two-component system OmpR family response regulator